MVTKLQTNEHSQVATKNDTSLAAFVEGNYHISGTVRQRH